MFSPVVYAMVTVTRTSSVIPCAGVVVPAPVRWLITFGPDLASVLAVPLMVLKVVSFPATIGVSPSVPDQSTIR